MVTKVRVLVVDDSSFFRKRIRSDLEQGGHIEVVGEAENGDQAVRMTAELKPDLVTMDVAMPVKDGIQAVREIMRTHPTRIIMFSALTREGAQSTLDALDAGAVDFLPKQGSISGGAGASGSLLRERVLSIVRTGVKPERPVETRRAVPPEMTRRSVRARFSALLIGASTGGPVAVQNVLSGLPASYPHPVVVAVHMPAAFTPTFATRLNDLCALRVSEARDSDLLERGRVLIAPGGKRIQLVRRGPQQAVRIDDGGDELYKPSIDLFFGSAADVLGGDALGLILTGMGSDGAEGARQLKSKGATIWSQDRESSVVYGMPQAVARAGLSDRVLALNDISAALREAG